MRSNYRPIGNYIRKVDHRNSDLKVTKLLGLSMTKEFRDTTSNTIGTDMSVYKVMSKYQFACDFMSPIRVSKLPVVLKLDNEPNLVSPAYPVFEVVDRNQLDPEFLMMWFRRSEFDRYVTFKCDAAIRGGYEWDELCDTLIPVPSIIKQREVVAEYNTIQHRIKLNQQLIQKLEETAQAIYKQWFVDFEFPNEMGKPYKTSGGKMERSELGEIPKGWQTLSFTEVCKLSGGGTPSTDNSEFWNGDIPLYTPADLGDYYYSVKTGKKITERGLQKCSSKLFPANTSFVTARGATVGGVALAGIPMAMNQTCYAINGRLVSDYYAHQLTLNVMLGLKREAVGATFEALVTKNFESQIVLMPDEKVLHLFDQTISPFYSYVLNGVRQLERMNYLKNLLLSKLATIED